MLHGESRLTVVRFAGRDRAHARRKAFEFWYRNRELLRLNLRDFFSRCRLGDDERTITFSRVPESG